MEFVGEFTKGAVFVVGGDGAGGVEELGDVAVEIEGVVEGLGGATGIGVGVGE